MTNPVTITLKEGVDFGYVVDLSPLPPPTTYAGYKIRCDIKFNGFLIHDFGEIAVQPQSNKSGMCFLQSSTDSWPKEEALTSDILLIDPQGNPVRRSPSFYVYISKGNTDLTTGT